MKRFGLQCQPLWSFKKGFMGRQMLLHLLFLPAISASTKFYFSSPINFLRFLLLAEPIIELLLLLWLYYIAAALLFCHLENIKLKQPTIILVGDRLHADTSCSGCSQGCPSEAFRPFNSRRQYVRPLNSTRHRVAFTQVDRRVAGSVGSTCWRT